MHGPSRGFGDWVPHSRLCRAGSGLCELTGGSPRLGRSSSRILAKPRALFEVAYPLQEVELYAEVHKDVAASNYTPIAREACSTLKHVSPQCLSQ